jgi:hypothetical protein
MDGSTITGGYAPGRNNKTEDEDGNTRADKKNSKKADSERGAPKDPFFD